MLTILSAVFVASVLGSMHCVGMCGPFAALATTQPSARPGQVHLPVVGAMHTTMAYNVGRLLTYVTMGLIAGGVGMLVQRGGSLVGLPEAAASVAGVSMVLLGVAGLLRAWGVRLPLGARLGFITNLVSRLMRSLGDRPPTTRALWLGAVTTLIPCGWLHAFTLTAAGTGSPLHGLAVMVTFWLGTVPAMTLLGTTIHRLSPRVRKHIPWVMPALVLAVGLHMLLVRGQSPAATGTTAEATITDQEDATINTTVPDAEAMPCH